jgi:hypothetical protein
MLAEMGGCCEVYASNWHVTFLRQIYPICSCIYIAVGIVDGDALAFTQIYFGNLEALVSLEILD